MNKLQKMILRMAGLGGIQDRGKVKGTFTIRKYADDQAFAAGLSYEETQFTNVLLNEGITALLNLLVGNAETNFGNANAYIGVGDSSTAAAASQTALQAASNKLYKAVEASYPSISAQTVTWRAIYGSSEANFAWNEFTVASGSSDAADNLNRAVSSQGTKTSGQTWTIDLAITFS